MTIMGHYAEWRFTDTFNNMAAYLIISNNVENENNCIMNYFMIGGRIIFLYMITVFHQVY